ncbi:MAG: ABC transporter [Aureobasidium pullulans]|nr:MAG: ABC transporter [Aureobasidium pullulans]
MGERATRQETWSVEASKASGHAQTFFPFLPCISSFEQQQKSVDGLRDQSYLAAQGYAQFNISMSSSQPTLTPAERIRELSAINADVPALLSSAANAVNALTTAQSMQPLPTATTWLMLKATTPQLLTRKPLPKTQPPTSHTSNQSWLGYVVKRAAPETAGLARRGPQGQPQRQPAEDGDRVTNGGLGGLDVGLLNSRGNSVGLDKEAELIAEAKQMVADMLKERQRSA